MVIIATNSPATDRRVINDLSSEAGMFVRAARVLIAAMFFFCILSFGQANRGTQRWPTQDGWVTLPNFKFGTGATLPELKLHYLTFGSPHRNAAGHVDTAVLFLHGAGGDAHSLMNPVFSDVLFVPDGVLDIQKY